MENFLFQVNAFTGRPFAGNPAAVCLTAAPLATELMQAIAAEMNLSETAFVHPLAKGSYALRWFTPTTEVALCGHATLAAAHVLFSEGKTKEKQLFFETQSGLLCVSKEAEHYHMLFPALPCQSIDIPEGLGQALNSPVKACFRSTFDLVVELDNEAAVRACVPNFHLLATYPYRGIIITAAAQPPFDFVSRFFGPNCGVNEDPVTGSAHCALAPLWAQRLQKTSLRAFQASKRGGIVEMELLDKQVILKGEAVTIWSGRLQPQLLSS
jgi:PhzF family phenazine biosynthesis protein